MANMRRRDFLGKSLAAIVGLVPLKILKVGEGDKVKLVAEVSENYSRKAQFQVCRIIYDDAGGIIGYDPVGKPVLAEHVEENKIILIQTANYEEKEGGNRDYVFKVSPVDKSQKAVRSSNILRIAPNKKTSLVKRAEEPRITGAYWEKI